MAAHVAFATLKTATKIALIFVAIVTVFALARDRSGPSAGAGYQTVIEQPIPPKRALSSLGASEGAASAALVAGMGRRL